MGLHDCVLNINTYSSKSVPAGSDPTFYQSGRHKCVLASLFLAHNLTYLTTVRRLFQWSSSNYPFLLSVGSDILISPLQIMIDTFVSSAESTSISYLLVIFLYT